MLGPYQWHYVIIPQRFLSFLHLHCLKIYFNSRAIGSSSIDHSLSDTRSAPLRCYSTNCPITRSLFWLPTLLFSCLYFYLRVLCPRLSRAEVLLELHATLLKLLKDGTVFRHRDCNSNRKPRTGSNQKIRSFTCQTEWFIPAATIGTYSQQNFEKVQAHRCRALQAEDLMFKS